MSEPTETPTEPIVDNGAASPQGDGESSPQPKEEDLVTRATRFVEETKPEGKSDDEIDAQFWGDQKLKEHIDSIEDDDVRTQLQGLRKSLISGANGKYMELSEKINQLEAATQQKPEQWTAERINQLMQDPTFVMAAQQAAGTQSEGEFEDDGLLPDSVKAKLSELDEIKQKMQSMESGQEQALRQAEHARLSERYGNYDAKQMDEITQSVLERKAHIGLEDIYKAVRHDENVKRAYEMGLKDGQNGLADASQIPSLPSSSGIKPQASIDPQEGEPDKSYFVRLGLNNLLKAKKRT